MTEAHKPGRQAHAPRHLARVFALLGFYQWIADPPRKAQKIEENLPALLADDEEGTPVEDLGLTSEDWARCDRELLTTLLSGAIGEHAALEAEFSPFVDRDLKRVSLVERAILFIGTYELLRCPQTPIPGMRWSRTRQPCAPFPPTPGKSLSPTWANRCSHGF